MTLKDQLQEAKQKLYSDFQSSIAKYQTTTGLTIHELKYRRHYSDNAVIHMGDMNLIIKEFIPS